MFPGAGASVTYNDAGEPLGWDYPSEYEGMPESEPYDMDGFYYDDDVADGESTDAADDDDWDLRPYRESNFN